MKINFPRALRLSLQLLLIAIVVKPPTLTLASTATMTLDEFLTQVKKDNPGVKGSILGAHAGELRSEEGQILLAPTVFANFKYVSDAKLQPMSFLSYDNLVAKTYSLGVSKQTTFGLQAKFHYDLYSQNYNNPSFLFPISAPGASSPIPFSFANASPVLELTQNLWSNGFGRSTRATQEQLEAQALASSFAARFQFKADLSEAETNYWRLAIARQTISVQKEALDRAKKIYEWNSRRARLQLGDQSDVLQAEALLKTRELDVIAAENEARSASRAFNSSRNFDSDQVPEQLVSLDPEVIQSVAIPRRAELRDDVKAAQQSTRASIASAQVAQERDAPTLDLFASLALNGQQGNLAFANLSDSLGPSFSFSRPTQTVGIQFSMPLNFGVTSRSREGWRQEHVAAELNYEKKLFEQEQSWKNLVENLNEAKTRLSLSRKIELIQQSKLTNEKNRLNRGRTTTYQVLLFEQDYLLAQLTRIRNQVIVLNIIAQMKLFGESL